MSNKARKAQKAKEKGFFKLKVKPDLRKRTWDNVDSGLGGLNYDEETSTTSAFNLTSQRRKISYDEIWVSRSKKKMIKLLHNDKGATGSTTGQMGSTWSYKGGNRPLFSFFSSQMMKTLRIVILSRSWTEVDCLCSLLQSSFSFTFSVDETYNLLSESTSIRPQICRAEIQIEANAMSW